MTVVEIHRREDAAMILYEGVERAMVLLERGRDDREVEEIRRSLRDTVEQLSRATSEMRRDGYDETAKLVEETISLIRRAMSSAGGWGDEWKEPLERAFDRAFVALETLRNEAGGEVPPEYGRLLRDVRYDASSVLSRDAWKPTYGQSAVKKLGGGSFSKTF